MKTVIERKMTQLIYYILRYKIYHQKFIYLHVNWVVLTFRNEWILTQCIKVKTTQWQYVILTYEYVKNLTQKFLYEKISTEI